MEGREDDYGYHRLGLISLVLLSCAINGALSGRIRGAVVDKVREKKVKKISEREKKKWEQQKSENKKKSERNKKSEKNKKVRMSNGENAGISRDVDRLWNVIAREMELTPANSEVAVPSFDKVEFSRNLNKKKLDVDGEDRGRSPLSPGFLWTWSRVSFLFIYFFFFFYFFIYFF